MTHIDEINRLIDQRTKYLQEGFNTCFGKKDNVKIGVYGTGLYAQEMFSEYKLMFGKIDFEPIMFDSNPEKTGKLFSPYPHVIHSIDHIANSHINRLVIASEDYFDEIFAAVCKVLSPDVEVVCVKLNRCYKKL